jgi:hypothetical protein
MTDKLASAYPNEEETPTFLRQAQTAVRLENIQLKPVAVETPIVAIDVSSIRIGETSAGTLIAIRGAIIWKQQNHCRYLRIGPFPFHKLRKTKLKFTGCSVNIALP